jgi:RNA 3'-terminal phosphate cyclase (ATP)
MTGALARRLRAADRSPLGLDASHGEGGGQVLRTALALSVALGRAVALTGVRARRPRPGLQPQHLTVVRALAAISGAAVDGDHLGSTALDFAPRALKGGDYRFDVGAIRGSAGSVSLLFQSLLLPLLLAEGPSRLELIGGTHVPWSPPADYLTAVFLPAVRAAGVRAEITLRRWGWYPAGGGAIAARIDPADDVRAVRLESCTPPASVRGLSAVSRLPVSIAERQREQARQRLRAAGVGVEIDIAVDEEALSPGTLLFLAAPGRAGFSALGRRGLPAERVADAAVDELLAWLPAGAAVDDHLADQLVPVLALAGAPSVYTCARISSHLRAVAWVVEQMLPVTVALREGPPAEVGIAPR